nr:AraC family transcriptional regulator [Chromobacterium sp. ASV5]
MHVAILAFNGCNEIDSLVAFNMLSRAQNRLAGFHRQLDGENPAHGGLTIDANIALPEACEAEAVIVGCGAKTREIIADAGLMAQLRLDPARQLVGAQCSGAPILARLGWLNGIPACADLASRPWAQAEGVDVLRQSFFAKDNVATAGGCLASVVLAVWVLARLSRCPAP